MKKKVVIYVEGGVVQEIMSDDKDIEVEVFDVDNKQADGMSNSEIDDEWDITSKGMTSLDF
jgi:hypothetical protein